MTELSESHWIYWEDKWWSVYRAHADTYEVWNDDDESTFHIEKMDLSRENYDVDVG